MLADHKLPVSKILKMAFTLMHKLREDLLRAHNVGFLCGVQEVDGMDANDRRYREKRNKPQGCGGAPKPVMPAD